MVQKKVAAQSDRKNLITRDDRVLASGQSPSREPYNKKIPRRRTSRQKSK